MLLSVLSAFLFAFQFVTVAKFSVLPAGASHITFGNFIHAVQESVQFDGFDALLVACMATIGALLLYLEARYELVTSFLRTVFVSDSRTVVLLIAASFVLVRYYLAVGNFNWAGDVKQHIATAYMASRAIASGEFPIWTFYIGNGSAYLQHYGFLYPCLVGFTNLLVGDFFISMKIVLVMGHLLSGVGMYYFVARLCSSRRAGFIAGIGYVICFWHVQQVLIMGRTPLGLFYGLLPWAFYAFEQSMRADRRVRGALCGGISVALLCFTHPAYGFYACVLLLLYAIIRLWTLRTEPAFKGMIGASFLYMLCALSFSAYINVGMLVESSLTNMSGFEFGLQDPDDPNRVLPGPTWRHVLGWSNFRFWLLPLEERHWYGGYLGLSLIALGFGGGAGLCFHRDRAPLRRYLPGFCMLLLVTAVIVAYDLPPLNSIRLIHVFNPSRYLLFVTFFISLAAGVGTHLALLSRPRWISRSRCFTVLLFVLLLDLGPTTFQQPFVTDRELFFPQLSPVDEQTDDASNVPNFRAQWATDGGHSAFTIARMIVDKGATVSEVYHPGELPASEVFTDPIMHAVRSVLRESQTAEGFAGHPVRDLLLRGFRLLNTRFVLATTRTVTWGFVVEIDHSSPVVASPRIVPFAAEPVTASDIQSELGEVLELGKLYPIKQHQVKNGLRMVHAMGLAPRRNYCERLLISPDGEAQDLGTTPDVEVLEHTVGHHDVRLNVRMIEAGFVRLAYAYYPFLDVSVDGSAVVPIETADRFIALKLDAGAHAISIEARLSPLRRALLWIAFGVLLVVGTLAMREPFSRVR